MMTTLPDGLDEETYRRALILAKLSSKTYDYDDNLVAKIGMAFFSGINDIKEQDFSTPNFQRIRDGGGLIDIVGLGDAGLDYTIFQEKKKNENGNESGGNTVVLAFRGTEPLSIEDWGTNLNQLLRGKLFKGTDKQYEQAIKVALALSKKIEEENHNIEEEKNKKTLYLTGHSLGGGLATAASLATGRETIVFDSAGVSTGTYDYIKKKFPESSMDDSKIVNINVRECFVSDPNSIVRKLQDLLETQQYGRQYFLESVSYRANFFGLPDSWPVVKIAESILNHAWHVYTYQLEKMLFDDDGSDAGISSNTAAAMETPQNKRRKTQHTVT